MAKQRSLPMADAPEQAAVARRHVLQGLLAGVGAGLVVPGLADGHPLREHGHHPGRIADAQARAKTADGPPEFLDAYQMGLLASLGERIVPGATAAGCARFIDSLLAVGSREDAQRFLTALGAVDAEARVRFEKPWPELAEGQQTELLEVLSTAEPGRAGTSWTPGTPVADYLERAKEPSRTTLRDEYEHLKGWVVGAYYTSEAGLRELGWTGPVFAESFPGCLHPDGHR